MGLKDCHEFIDLYSFDPSTAIEFGLPVDQFKGMILLFPLGNGEEETFVIDDYNSSADTFDLKFIKQTIENSCCMMALLHILLNNPKELLQESKPEIIDKLIEKKYDLDKLIEGSIELESIHKEMALIGGTDVPKIGDNVPFHFVALIPEKRSIWLMDGRRSNPIEYKNEEKDSTLFEAACKVATEEFVMKSNDQNNFAALILI